MQTGVHRYYTDWSIHTVHIQEYTEGTQTGIQKGNRQEYTHSTPIGVYRQYTDRSMQTVHRQEYTHSIQTGVNTVHGQEYTESEHTV